MTTDALSNLTPEQKRVRVAELCGNDRMFTLRKRGLFYRPGGAGYTSNESEAWKMSEKEADKHVYPHDEPVTKHVATPPDYLNDLNACVLMEETLTTGEAWEYNRKLSELLGTAGGMGSGAIDEWSWHATAAQRVDAFLLTKG